MSNLSQVTKTLIFCDNKDKCLIWVFFIFWDNSSISIKFPLLIFKLFLLKTVLDILPFFVTKITLLFLLITFVFLVAVLFLFISLLVWFYLGNYARFWSFPSVLFFKSFYSRALFTSFNERVCLTLTKVSTNAHMN